MTIKDLYENTELPLARIAEELGTTYKVVQRYVSMNYTKEYRSLRKQKTYRNSKLKGKNPMWGKRRDDHPNYRGVVPDSKGYLMELKPSWYTGRKKSKHVFQHHVVVARELGLSEIPKGWVVHHCDMDPYNNEFDNLILLTVRDHTRLHNYLEGATTISKESTLKWVEAHGTVFNRDDIV